MSEVSERYKRLSDAFAARSRIQRELDDPAGASDQDRLVAFLGRRP